MGKKWKRLLVERRKVAQSAVVEAAPVEPAKKVVVVAPVVVEEAAPVVVDETPVAVEEAPVVVEPVVEKASKTKPFASRKTNSKVRRKTSKED